MANANESEEALLAHSDDDDDSDSDSDEEGVIEVEEGGGDNNNDNNNDDDIDDESESEDEEDEGEGGEEEDEDERAKMDTEKKRVRCDWEEDEVEVEVERMNSNNANHNQNQNNDNNNDGDDDEGDDDEVNIDMSNHKEVDTTRGTFFDAERSRGTSFQRSLGACAPLTLQSLRNLRSKAPIQTFSEAVSESRHLELSFTSVGSAATGVDTVDTADTSIMDQSVTPLNTSHDAFSTNLEQFSFRNDVNDDNNYIRNTLNNINDNRKSNINNNNNSMSGFNKIDNNNDNNDIIENESRDRISSVQPRGVTFSFAPLVTKKQSSLPISQPLTTSFSSSYSTSFSTSSNTDSWQNERGERGGGGGDNSSDSNDFNKKGSVGFPSIALKTPLHSLFCSSPSQPYGNTWQSSVTGTPCSTYVFAPAMSSSGTNTHTYLHQVVISHINDNIPLFGILLLFSFTFSFYK